MRDPLGGFVVGGVRDRNASYRRLTAEQMAQAEAARAAGRPAGAAARALGVKPSTLRAHLRRVARWGARPPARHRLRAAAPLVARLRAEGRPPRAILAALAAAGVAAAPGQLRGFLGRLPRC